MALQTARVPILDPVTGRFPDSYQPPQVAADAAAAAQSATDAATSASAAASSATAAQTAQTGAETAQTGAETAQTATQTARTGAESARDAAASSATSASGSASTATTQAGIATAKASDAAASATAAQTSAGQAATSETNAAGSATAAADSATAASGSASAAATSEVNAAGSASVAQTAQTGAETARTGAETARTGAETAQTAAQAARTGAETAVIDAQGSATNAANSATSAQQARDAVNSLVITPSVTTLAAGAPATAEVSGTTPDMTLALGIPQGAKGDPGGWVNSATRSIGTDLNTVTAPGTYYCLSGAANTVALHYPSDGWGGYLEIIALSSTIIMQRATAIYSTPGAGPLVSVSQNMWERSCVSGAWGPWLRVGLHGDPGGPDLVGTVIPNGVFTAPPGTYYTDIAGTCGAWRWLKKSGTGNTGWECVVGDTGWRNVAATHLAAGWQLGETGRLLVRRAVAQVSASVRVSVASDAAFIGTSRTTRRELLMTLPVGFRQSWPYTFAAAARFNLATAGLLTNGGVVGGLDATGPSGAWTAGDEFVGEPVWSTNEAWPTVLPGTPA